MKKTKKKSTTAQSPRVALSRESLPEIVRVFTTEPDKSPRSWNIVEVLELLIDGGQFRVAEQLCERVIEMVQGDGRERLFLGYAALCRMMIGGSQSEAIEELERLYIEIDSKGHSLADRVRSGLLLSRALAICAGLGTLPQGVILRARSVLDIELERAAQGDDAELYAQVLVELAKMYLHAPTPDSRAALSLVEFSKQELLQRGVPAWRVFDVMRVAYQAAKLSGSHSALGLCEESMRTEAALIGGVAPALVELAIARRATEISEERLEQAIDSLEANEFLSGAFEGSFILATSALERGHNVVGERFCLRALELAERGGFIHGVLLALVGLFQSASIADNMSELKSRCAAIVARLDSELALGSSGLNAAAAQQIIGDVEGAAVTARRCEQFFGRQGLFGFQAQALAIVGTCEAHAGRWGKAGVAWSKALQLDEQRNAFIQVCERRGLVVQAWVMEDMTKLGHLRDKTVERAEAMLARGDRSVERLGDMHEAVSARARLQSVHAQLYVMAGQHVKAMRHLSTARGLFESLGAEYDVAMVDAFTGLSMLEVGKTGAPDLLEEAVLTLQRASQFFSSPAFPPIRWKISYYLSVAGLHVSNNQGDPFEKGRWRDLALGWLRSAEQDLKALDEGLLGSLGTGLGAPTDFSPGLKPEALEGLRQALGVRERGRERRSSSVVDKALTPGDGYVH
jgi:tetratricopeptide (TPR) repeat protein